MFQKDDVDSQSLAIMGIFSAVAVFVLIILVQVLYYRMDKADELEKNVLHPGHSEKDTVLTEQRGALSAYKWVDKGKGVAAVDINRAMEVVLKDLKAKSPK